MSLKTWSAWLISFLRQRAVLTTTSSGIWTSGMCGDDDLICNRIRAKYHKDHQNKKANNIAKWMDKTRKSYLLMNDETFAQRKSIDNAKIRQWQTKVRRKYSISTNTTQTAVTAPNTPAVTFLFLHNTISAAGQQKINTILISLPNTW